MIVDTSALIALIADEPTARGIDTTLRAEARVRMSTASYVELCAVLSGRDVSGAAFWAKRLLSEYRITLAPFDAEQARIAGDAYQTYGRGHGHPARLNLGDCFSYALATAVGEPLLFVGDDFTHTDIEPVPLPG